MKTINITPTWTASAKIYALILENGNAKGREEARAGIVEMGQHIDTLLMQANELLNALEGLRAVVIQSKDRTIYDNGKNAEAVAIASELVKKYNKTNAPAV